MSEPSEVESGEQRTARASATPEPDAPSGSGGAVAALARREIQGYLRSPLFIVGLGLTAAVTIVGYVGKDDGTSSTMNMIVPAALLGVLGLIVMAGLTRRSDRAATAAGAVAVGERDRTLALVAAIVVPVTAALVWYIAVVVQYVVQPPSAGAVPFGPIGDSHVLAVMFALGVLPAAGGPILGLLVARWLPGRGVTALTVVVLVLVTIVLQGNFEWSHRWHVVWPWTYWYGPLGWSGGGPDGRNWLALPGSPFAWIGYLVALIVLGVLVAVYHDADRDRRRLHRAIPAVGALAALALVLTFVLGLDQTAVNPVVGLSF